MKKTIGTGNVVKECYLGNTHIIICDDYAVKTKEERIAILTDLKKLIYELSNK